MILAAALAIYTFAVAIVYALLYAYRPTAAEALIVLFIGLLLVPACIYDIARARRRRR